MGVHNRASAFFLAVLFALSSVLLVVPDTPVGTVTAGEVDIGDCPRASDGYGYDPATATFEDHNGFLYSYLPDGVIRLELPWGYTTYFSYGLTGTYLGVAQKVTALSYTWTWDAEATEAFDAGGNLTGYDYSFTATNSATLKWTITLDFFANPGQHMKVTHTVQNGYPSSLLGVEFWYLFDLTHTPSPSVTTNAGTYYPPLYADLPASITWARLSNQFQFDWRDAGWPNGHAYLGSGSVVGLAVDILGVSLNIGTVSSGQTVTVDPYFSGVTRTWAALAASYSGIAASWSPAGVPATGDNITFDATSVFNCNWNTSVTVGNFNMNTGYSGMVTQLASFGSHNFIITAGNLYGSIPLSTTISGNLTFNGGTIQQDVFTFILTGTSKQVSILGTQRPYQVSVSNGATISLSTAWQVRNLVIDLGCSFSVNTGQTLEIFMNSASYVCDIRGTIAGAGNIYLYLYGSTLNFYGGGTWTIANTYISNRVSAIANSYYILTSDWIISGAFSIVSAHISYTTTLDTNGFDVSIGANFAMYVRTTIICDSSNIILGASSDFSLGSINSGTSTVYLTGAGSTVKTATGGSFYNLIVGGTYTTQSSLNVSHSFQVNSSKSLTVATGHTVTVDDITNLGQVIGTGSLVVEATDARSITLGTVTTAPVTLQAEATATDDTQFTLEADCSLGAGLTVESDHASYGMTLYNDGYDLTLTGGDLVIASDGNLLLTGGTVALADDMTVAGTLNSTGTDYAVSDDCTLSGAALVTGGDLTVDGDLNVTGVTTLNPDTIGLWAVRVLGAGVLSVTNLSLSTSQDLYVGPSASLVVSDDDMSIGGNLTVLGDWTRGDNVVTMTGTADLEMVSTESFFNITIALGATITMDNDTYVDLRATILGTMAGTGDFLEPSPAFLTVPDLSAVPLEVYNYSIDQLYWDTLTLVDAPTWLSLYGSELKGVPTEADAGAVNVSLLLSWNDMAVYQNFTLWVSVPAVAEDTYLVLEVVMSIVIGLAFMVLGFYQKKSPWTFVAGLFWLFAALAVYSQLSAGWTMLSLGVGLVLLIDGGRKIAEQE